MVPHFFDGLGESFILAGGDQFETHGIADRNRLGIDLPGQYFHHDIAVGENADRRPGSTFVPHHHQVADMEAAHEPGRLQNRFIPIDYDHLAVTQLSCIHGSLPGLLVFSSEDMPPVQETCGTELGRNLIAGYLITPPPGSGMQGLSVWRFSGGASGPDIFRLSFSPRSLLNES